jgi:ribonuclease E
MVEMPSAEPTYVTNAAEEAKAIRPVAAVKGITPAAPAPIVAEKTPEVAPKLSLFARIKNFFTSSSDSAEQQKETNDKNSESRREGGRNRNRNRNRNERNRGDRGEKNINQERTNRNQETKTQEPRPADAKQDQRQPKPQQQRNDQQRNQPVITAPDTVANDTAERTERSGRRNRNNRRNRRDRDENAPRETNRPFVPNDEIASTSTENANTVVNTTDAIPVASAPSVNANQPVVKSVIVEKTAETQSDEPQADLAKPATGTEGKKAKATKGATKKAVVDTVIQESIETTESDTAKVEKKRPARARKPKAEAKQIDLSASGLQLVETKSDMPKAATPIETEKPRAPRRAASWQKQAKEDVATEPLVMVETQNK